MDATTTNRRLATFDARAITDAARTALFAGDYEYGRALADLADHAGEVARLAGVEGGFQLALDALNG